MLTLGFRPEVELKQFRARALKNMQYNPYLRPNRRNFRVLTGNRGQATRW